MKFSRKIKKKEKQTCEKPYPSEEGFANLLEGLMYVLAREAKSHNIDIVHEAKSANFENDLMEYLDELEKEIEENTETQMDKVI